MDDAAGILVILLSVILLIFLVLLSFLVVLLIRISKQIKHIADDAEKTAHDASTIMGGIGRFTKPLIAAKIVTGIFTKRRKGDK